MKESIQVLIEINQKMIGSGYRRDTRKEILKIGVK